MNTMKNRNYLLEVVVFYALFAAALIYILTLVMR